MKNENKWLFGPRKTTEKPTAEMCSYELMLNNCYVDNQSAMYRDFDESRDIRSLIRDIAKSMRVYLTDDPELLDMALFEYLDDELDTTTGVLGLLYSLLWSKAELYEKLKRYEDAEERGEIGRVPRWIPVTPETMPNVTMTGSGYEETAVIVAVRGFKKTYPMIYQRACVRGKTVYRWKWVWGKIYDGPEITHWMPFPKFDMGSESDES